MMIFSNMKDAAKKIHKGSPRLWAALLALTLAAGMLAVPAAADGDEPGSTGGFDIGIISNEGMSSSDLGDFVSKVEIKDSKGEVVPSEGGQLFVGEKYKIHLEFTERGALGMQYNAEAGTLTYQIPDQFDVEPQTNQTLKVTIDGKEVEIGTYSVNDNGILTVTLDENGKNALKESSNVTLTFDMDATAMAPKDGDSGKVDFGGTGQKFTFDIVDQARVEVDKQGKYTENADKTGGQLEYTVKTTVKHGQVDDLSILDELTPPNTSALEIKDVNTDEIKVTLKKPGAEEPVVLEQDRDYELVEVDDAEHPGKKTFQVRLKEDSEYTPLTEGEELSVTYPYAVQYVPGTTDVFWGNVPNDVTVTGKGKVLPPADEPDKEMPEIDINEHRGSSVEIQVVPPGNGIIFKTQEFSEADHKLHYTLYTLVPAGTWEPFYIHDDMTVEFGGASYNLQEFNKGGRVSNLKVSAVDVENGELGDWSGEGDEQKQQSLETLKANACQLTGYDMYNVWQETPEGYNPESLENYICLWLNNNLEIVFGKWKYEDQVPWGNWSYQTDRLIITEYDLDMSDDQGPLTLIDKSDYETTLEKEASEVLLAGIWNVVHMRFSGYYPGYSVFFNNAERMNKTGVADKNDNTITWTVTMNTTDTTVNQYFQEVKNEWMALNAEDKYHWGNMPKAYEESMQAVFYDELPEGWEYVEDSLTATACDIWSKEYSYSYDKDGQLKGSHVLVTQDVGKQVIRAPLMFFYDKGLSMRNLFDCFNENLKSLTFTYKLKATDDWIKAHVAGTENVKVSNHAEIRDKLHPQAHWEADAEVPYLPQRLTKTAEQVGTSNLLRFTLQVNPGPEDLDKDKDYLIVKDASSGIEIQTGSIVVKDAEGNPLVFKGNVTESTPIGPGEWGFMPPESTEGEEEGQFRLMVPDEMKLTITYEAVIPISTGDATVSNEAEIRGVDRTETGYEKSLHVDQIYAGGEGNSYNLGIEKTDKSSGKMLAGAEFTLYLVVPGSTHGMATVPISVGDKTYQCYMEEGWKFTTEEEKANIFSGERIAQGNYYILVENKAPDGYIGLEKPILFYYGMDTDEAYKEKEYPGAVVVMPGGTLPTLTVPNPPRKVLTFKKADAAALEAKPDNERAYLEGAAFELWKGKRDEAGTRLYEGTSKEGGVIEWTVNGEPDLTELTLDDGVYYLYETKAPDGYNLLEEPIFITVSGETVTVTPDTDVVKVDQSDTTPQVTVTVLDQAAPYELPESGGAGTAGLYILGTALVFTAALALVRDARRRKARD